MKSSGLELARTKKTSVQRCKQDFQLARLIEMDAMNNIELNSLIGRKCTKAE